VPRNVAALDDSPSELATAPATPQPVEPRVLPSTPAALAPLWSKVIRAEGISALLRAVLINSTLESLEGGRATIVCAGRYAADAQKKWRGSIVELLSRESGAPIELTIQSTDGGVIQTPSPAAAEPADASSPNSPTSQTPTSAPPAPSRPGAPNSAAEHPLVKQALELFGGRIVDIQPRRR
jgi:hypothetical protein